MTPAQLRATRKALGLTQTALAARLGVTRMAFVWWETGRHPMNKTAALLLGYIAREAGVAIPPAAKSDDGSDRRYRDGDVGSSR